MPPPYIESTLFNMKHQSDFTNNVLHLEVVKEITKAHKTSIMNRQMSLGMGIAKELDTGGRIHELLDKVKAWSITASDEVVFSH